MAGPRREPSRSATPRFPARHRGQLPGQEQLAVLACPVLERPRLRRSPRVRLWARGRDRDS